MSSIYKKYLYQKQQNYCKLYQKFLKRKTNVKSCCEFANENFVIYTQVEVCRSHHTSKWLGALYIYKGLLLIVGVYMAWETRHVKISALNDSQYIGVSVYSVVITSASVVVLANLLSERVTLAFIITTSFILSSTTATLCLLFLPKINDILNKGIIEAIN